MAISEVLSLLAPLYTNSLTIDMQFRGRVCSRAAWACRLKTDMRSVNSLDVLFSPFLLFISLWASPLYAE